MCGCSGGGSLARVAMRKNKPCKGIKQYDASVNAMLTYPIGGWKKISTHLYRIILRNVVKGWFSLDGC